ncbi:sacsin N-terminal ATP-binding-like domain-containing protein [Streptomyces mirabilis]|uniref:sacsin N-terminal ATP-binding-like domain-containing protein n=1 Tax=Streptomyces mirabilis TaxID=68239 RepID=UPI00224D0078|nr:helicase-related protein [Streptomyces mirabilis]MCX4429589.1 DEAD/DEAH box helicase family protein [Streptomyces mirabilis]
MTAVRDLSHRSLDVYRADPRHVLEHANLERDISRGGYSDRQIYELVQNGADEIQNKGRIQVVLTDTHLYCSNTGSPVSAQGVDTILHMSSSAKRGGKIGRFGVGVKSVLSVCDTPRFFSTSGSFGFDKQWSSQLIRQTVSVPEDQETPVLRMAQVLDEVAERRTDRRLDALMEWASTVVVLPLKPGAAERLGGDLHNFPVHFQLFSPHVDTVILEDARTGRHRLRVIDQEAVGDVHTIREQLDGKQVRTEQWRVFPRNHSPSPEALEAAGDQHGRPTIRICWAIPGKGVKNRSERGEFWAYFPTHYNTTLTGVLNAAWQTNPDRQNLQTSPFNTELIRAAAELIVDSVPKLVEADDPGSYLTLLTARGREAAQWADRQLSANVLDAAVVRASVPDQSGNLREPKKLHLHPENLQPEWLRLWAEHPGRPADWVHHSVEARDRRSRVRDIMERADRSAESVKDWLEALVSDGSPGASVLALLIAADMKSKGSALAAEAARARILLTEGGELHEPRPGAVYRRVTASGALQDGQRYVHPEVVLDREASKALNILGITEASAVGRLEAVLDIGFARYGDGDWAQFWELTRHAGGAPTVAVIRERCPGYRETIKVRCCDGRLRPLNACLLPGRVVPSDLSRDAHAAIDPRFHGPDMTVLRDLGAAETPTLARVDREAAWFAEYFDYALSAFNRSLPAGARHVGAKAIVVEGSDTAGPLELLLDLSEEGRAAYARALPRHGVPHHWTVRRPNTGAQVAVASPIVWLIQHQVHLPTSQGLLPVTESVAPALRAHGDLLPVAEVDSELAAALGLASQIHDVPAGAWRLLFECLASSDDDALVGRAYALLAQATENDADIPWPGHEDTRCRVGEEWASRPDGDIYVTHDRAKYRALKVHRLPALLAPAAEDAGRMRELWSMQDAELAIKEEIEHVPAGDPIPLFDLYPRLKQRLPHDSDLRVVHCSALARVVTTASHGREEEPLAQTRSGSDILLCGPEDELSVLIAVVAALGLRLDEVACRALLAQQVKDRENEKFVAVRREPDIARKLLLAIGVDRLRDRLPAGLLLTDEELRGTPADDLRVARLVMASYGDDILRTLAPAFREAGFEDTPTQWVGGSRTRAFLRTYGLPASWAGDPDDTPPPTSFAVMGPTTVTDLHDYQITVVTNMYRLLVQDTPQRAMLSLPTGAGKTRVAAEATIRAMRNGHLVGPVLWIAQSEELCEQAIATWEFLWPHFGSASKLHISRMRQGHHPEPFNDGHHLVVAVDDTLVQRLAEERYAWLRYAAAVIIDEAHFAIPKTYTRILDLLGIDQYRVSRPLIGLTATAYRGRNDEETRRLVKRFGERRLDFGAFDGDDENAAHRHLQHLGVLSRVQQRELPGGRIALTQAQAEKVLQHNGMRIPDDITKKLADDVSRTQRIIEEIERLDDSWSVLVFATSVEHSKVLAALLNDRGVSAAFIESKTRSSIRAKRIEDFRDGKIRVLTNYGVLTQGFDAPKVRAVVVARPTYSPNTYVQMIGRGLRGPANGGEPECLILNVRDNIENFGRDLAYTEFEHLWKKAY